MLASLASLILAASAGWGDAVAKEDRSGPSRSARCRIDEHKIEKCRFTPLFGDGSFNIELRNGDQIRVVVHGDDATAFIPMGPQKRIALMWTFHRSTKDRACWVSDHVGVSPTSICAY